MRTRSILFVITGLAHAGAETQLFHLATSLKSKGWDVHVVSMTAPHAFVDDLAQSGIPLTSLDMRRGIPDPLAFVKLVKLVNLLKPAIVHSHMVHANFMTRLSRIFCRIPWLICTAHSLYEGSRWREIAYRLTDPLCDLTTNVCRAGVERSIRIKTVPASKIAYVPNGIALQRFPNDRSARPAIRDELGISEQFVWLAVGRFERAKDYPNLMHAFVSHVQQFPHAVLLFAGRGELEQEIKQLAASLKLEGKVRFLGLRKDIPELMLAADAFIMSSAWEGMPMVLLEAAASRLPIVATDVGGNSDLVYDGLNGFVVPPRDSEALAEAMSRAVQLGTEARAEMGTYGRRHVIENFSLEAVVQKWEQLYTGFM